MRCDRFFVQLTFSIVEPNIYAANSFITFYLLTIKERTKILNTVSSVNQEILNSFLQLQKLNLLNKLNIKPVQINFFVTKAHQSIS